MIQYRQSVVRAVRRMMGPHEEAGPAGLRLRAWMMRHLPGQLTCMEFEQFVHDYQEGSLSRKERRAFDFHMDLCPMCRVYFASYLQTIELGRRVCVAEEEAFPADIPEDLVNAILDARSTR